LPTGDYYFCIRNGIPVPTVYNWCFVFVSESERPGSGFAAPSSLLVGDASYRTNWLDPFIVVRACDPTPANHPPVAVAAVDGPSSVQTGATVSFTSAGSEDADGSPLSFSWDFGDGNTDTAANPNHAYDQAGTYTVVLTVSDGWYAVKADPLTVTVLDAPPPQITTMKLERWVAEASSWTPVYGLHVGDNSTRLRLSATVKASDGGDCTDCDYEWSDNGSVISTNLVAEGTTAALQIDITQTGQRALTFKVTDRIPLNRPSASRRRLWNVSPLPTLRLELQPAQWGGKTVDNFAFVMPVWAVLCVGQIGLTNTGRLELTDLNGAPLLPEQPLQLNSLAALNQGLAAGNTYTITNLVRHDTYEWDPDDCTQARAALTTYAVENFSVQAVGLIDLNGYALPQVRAVNPADHVRVDVSDRKLDLYDEAFDDYVAYEAAVCTALGMTGAGIASAFFGPPGLVAAGVFAAGAAAAGEMARELLEAHDRACAKAHDPIVPDPQYQTLAWLAPSQLAVSQVALANEQASNLVRLGEACDLVNRARAAYDASLAKLAGVYELVPPVDPAWRQYAVQQGTEVIRQSKILADALRRVPPAWSLAAGAAPMTDVELRAAQEAVRTNGLPSTLADYLALRGVNVPAFTSPFLAAEAEPTAASWTNLASAAYEERAQLVLGQSYFAAPSGVVLVGVTEPLSGAGVNGVITIDARIVHKKEAYGHCACGDTVVTQVLVDTNLVAQVPPPNPHCPVFVPAPSAVPVQFDTRKLSEGPHTITVLAQDGCPAVPPDEVLHANQDSITIMVDRTAPDLALTVLDADPARPGVQVYGGDPITYQASDSGSGLVGPATGALPTFAGSYRQPIGVADRAGNSTVLEVEVLSRAMQDANGNGIPDGWDAAYLEGADQRGEADPDQDGASNLEEYIAGTDPKRAESVLALQIEWNDGPMIVFLARRTAGVGYDGLQRIYAVEYAFQPLPAEWQEFTEFEHILGDNQNIVLRPFPWETSAYFRVKVRLGTMPQSSVD
jgi:PKD repeat protein